MDSKKEKLMIDGNAFYEVDLECIERKEKMKKNKNSSPQKQRKTKERPGK